MERGALAGKGGWFGRAWPKPNTKTWNIL